MSATEISRKGPEIISPLTSIQEEIHSRWRCWGCCKKKKMIARQTAFDEEKALHVRVEIVAAQLNPDRKEIRKMMDRRNADGTVTTSLEIGWE